MKARVFTTGLLIRTPETPQESAQADYEHMLDLTREADRCPVARYGDKEKGFYRCIASRYVAF